MTRPDVPHLALHHGDALDVTADRTCRPRTGSGTERDSGRLYGVTPGLCGACGQPARRFPSGRWEHDGRPCRARTQTVWGVDDAALVRPLLRFVPGGDELPPASAGLRAWMRYEDTQ